MITVNRKANVMGSDKFDYDIKGLSSDTKPTEIGGKTIETNSLFLEVDTGDFYYFDGAAWQKVGG